MPITYHHAVDMYYRKKEHAPKRSTLIAIIQIVSPGFDEEYPQNKHIAGLVRFVGEKGRAYTPHAVITDFHGREQGDFIGQLIGKWGSGEWHLRFPKLAPGEYFFVFWLECGQRNTEVHTVRFLVANAIETTGGGV